MGNEKSTALYLLLSNRFLGNQKVAILKADFVYRVTILKKTKPTIIIKTTYSHTQHNTDAKQKPYLERLQRHNLTGFTCKNKIQCNGAMTNISKRKEIGLYIN